MTSPDSAPPRRPRADDPGSSPSSDGGARDVRILVVDDDLAVLDVACRILDRAGYSVVRAGGGAEALRKVAQGEESIDLLLTDVVMPSMSGRELAEALQERIPGLPVLFMSAYTEDEVILEGVRIAEVDFLPKPFSLKELVDGVEAVLDGR